MWQRRLRRHCILVAIPVTKCFWIVHIFGFRVIVIRVQGFSVPGDYCNTPFNESNDASEILRETGDNFYGTVSDFGAILRR